MPMSHRSRRGSRNKTTSADSVVESLNAFWISVKPRVDTQIRRIVRLLSDMTAGDILKLFGAVVWVVYGLWGFMICLAIVNDIAGGWGLLIGLALAPVTFVAAPWYALIAWGLWYPLSVCYGGGLAGTLLLMIGSRITRK